MNIHLAKLFIFLLMTILSKIGVGLLSKTILFLKYPLTNKSLLGYLFKIKIGFFNSTSKPSI